MAANTESSYWSLLEMITDKKDWYNKVFNDNIVDKWLSEIKTQSSDSVQIDDFWLCIRILRTTARGVYHDPECKWDEVSRLCPECLLAFRKECEKEHDITIEDSDDDCVVQDAAYDCGKKRCPHVACGCSPPDSELIQYIDYRDKDLLSQNLIDKLQDMVNIMRSEDRIDWHPGSNEQVRDIIHPSLYCYVKGVSKDKDGVVATISDELYRYQWLPSEISIDKIGQVKFTSYINNLHRKEYIPLFEEMLGAFLPSFEEVLDTSLKITKCQVIVKVGSIHLTPENPSYEGGVWHIEGMPYEHIIATGLYYLEVDNITPSFLEFRKPTVINEYEVNYPQSDAEYTSFHYGITNHGDGIMNKYLGLIRALPGSSVVFPNTLQHRVKDFKLKDDRKPGTRTIIAFFLIDPEHRITSTADIPEQYDLMTLGKACEFRQNLMFQRKYFTDDITKNVYEREFSLCEH